MRQRTPRGADLVIPALALGFAVYFFSDIAELAWEAKANGVLVGAILVVLIALQAGRIAVQLARGQASLGADTLWLPRDALAKRLGMVLITILFIWALEGLGLTLALLIAMLAALYVMGVRSRAALLWLPLGVAAAAYAMFIAFLKSEFPHGPVERLLALLLA